MTAGLPPEVISQQIYSGPGATPLLEVITAWNGIAEHYETVALEIRGVMASMAGVYQGESAQTMAAALSHYVMWVENTATAARQTAQAAGGAASAYGQVLASVVPPPMITANRSQLLMLVATNLLGQNTSAIAATEAQYEAMWAQDTAAMNAYQSNSSASIGQLPTFQAAPQVATPAAATSEPAASIFAPGSFLYDTFQSIVSSGVEIEVLQLFTGFFGPFLGSAVVAGEIGQQNAIIAGKPNAVVTPAPGGSPAKSVPSARASAGNAERLGKLSVPPSWASPKNQPLPSIAAERTPPGGGKSVATPLGLPVIPAVPVAGGKAKKKRSGYSDPDDMHYGAPTTSILKRHPSGG